MEKDQEVPFFSQFIALALLAFLVSSACYAIRQPSQNLAESAEPPAVRVRLSVFRDNCLSMAV